jgi:hypothetical protein
MDRSGNHRHRLRSRLDAEPRITDRGGVRDHYLAGLDAAPDIRSRLPAIHQVYARLPELSGPLIGRL